MGKFNEALHPRGFGGKFKSKGGGGKSVGKAIRKAQGPGKTRQENKVRALESYNASRAAGASRSHARNAARTQKALDKGKVVNLGGQLHAVHRKDRKKAAALNKASGGRIVAVGNKKPKAVKGYRSEAARKRAVNRNANDRNFSKGAKPVRAYKVQQRIKKRQARIAATPRKRK